MSQNAVRAKERGTVKAATMETANTPPTAANQTFANLLNAGLPPHRYFISVLSAAVVTLVTIARTAPDLSNVTGLLISFSYSIICSKLPPRAEFKSSVFSHSSISEFIQDPA